MWLSCYMLLEQNRNISSLLFLYHICVCISDCKDIRVNTEGENNIQFLSDLNIKSLKSTSLKFAVKSRKVAHILLMTSKSKNDPHYEIIIGSESSIVSNGKELDSHKGRLLNHRRSVAFGISWTNGVIKLTNGNRREIMSGKDQSEPLDIIDIGISTDSTGDWIFYCAGKRIVIITNRILN